MTTLPADAQQSTALVVQPRSDGAVVTYSAEAIEAELRRAQEMNQRAFAAAATEKFISADRFSAPVRVDRVKENTLSEDGQLSYNALATFGSFAGWPETSKIVVKGDKAFLRLDAGKKLTDTKGQVGLPVSKVFKKTLPYVLLQTGDKRILFTSNRNATMIGNKRLAFAVAIRASYAIKLQSKMAQSNAGGNRMQQASARPGGYQSKLGPIAGISPPRPVANTSGSGPIPQTPTGTPPQQQQPMDDEDDDEDEATRFLRKAIAILPEQSICSEPFLSDELKAAYLDDTSALTDGQRLMIEMKFPDVIVNKMPPDYALWAPNFSLNFDDLISIQMQNYAGQDDRDLLELYHISPDSETCLNPAHVLGDPEAVTTMCALPSDQIDAMITSRMADCTATKPFFSAIKWNVTEEASADGRPSAGAGGKPGGDKSKAAGQGSGDGGGTANRRHPLFCYLKGEKPKLSGTAYVTSWNKGTPYFAKCAECIAKGADECGHQPRGYVTAFFDLYQPVVNKFGIVSNTNWKKFMPIIVSTTEIWPTLVVNQKRNQQLTFNANNHGTNTIQMVVMKAIDVVHDLAGSLRNRIGIPVTPKMAAQLLGIDFPSHAMITASSPSEVSEVTNLTESKEVIGAFAATIAAECDFYVLTDSKIHAINCTKTRDNIKDPKNPLPNPAYGCLKRLTPEMGDAMFTGEWFDYSKAVEVSDRTSPILPSDELRTSTSKGADVNEATTARLVFAVRKETKASADRAKKSIEIFKNGAKYDSMLGFPIRENVVSDDQQPLIAAATSQYMLTPPPPVVGATKIDASLLPPAIAADPSKMIDVAPGPTSPLPPVVTDDLSAADLDFDATGTTPMAIDDESQRRQHSTAAGRATRSTDARIKMPSTAKPDESVPDRKRTRSRSPAPSSSSSSESVPKRTKRH